jgi:hypothetical protein
MRAAWVAHLAPFIFTIVRILELQLWEVKKTEKKINGTKEEQINAEEAKSRQEWG